MKPAGTVRPARAQRRGSTRLGLPLLAATLATGCLDTSRFDTGKHHAYCGSIVSAEFVRTRETVGGFRRELRLRVELRTHDDPQSPALLTTDDASDGPCAPEPTFASARLRTIPELSHDPLSTLRFGDGQEHNLMGWVDSTCRGPMLAIVSLEQEGSIEVRLLRPAPDPHAESDPRPAFALFQLARYRGECGF